MSKEKVIQLVKQLRTYIGLLIILVTLVAFYLFLKSNPGSLDPLKSVSLFAIPLIILLYFGMLVTNFFITAITIKISEREYPLKDSFMLTIYSTLVNFFGPLQSGPGFRAIYLKKKIGLGIKDYTTATMLYYGSFAAISLLMMFGPVQPLATLLALLVLAAFGMYVFRKQKLSSILRSATIIGLVTALQLALVSIIYYIELQATGYDPSITSLLAYTGSANFALFVSFTPGAIGIRESFLIFSQRLHGIPTENIISASLLDRSVYLVFLGLLFFLSSILHINKKLRQPK